MIQVILMSLVENQRLKLNYQKRKLMPTQSQKNSETLIRLEGRIEAIENNHLRHIEIDISEIKTNLKNLWKVIGVLCFMFTIVFAETVKSFIDLITL